MTDEDERVVWLKTLRKGRGLAKPRSDVPLELFGAEDWEGLKRTIMIASMLEPLEPDMVTLLEALNIADKDATLSERRSEMRWASGDEVSLRTVMRREEVAAVRLSNAIDTILHRRASEKLVQRARMLLETAVRLPHSDEYAREDLLAAIALLKSAWSKRVDERWGL